MKKQTFLILVSTTLLLLAAFALFESAAAQANFNAYLGASIDDSQIDGNIGTEWDDAGKTTGIVLNPQESAEVWTKNDGTNLYIAVRFTADSSNPWVAIQLGGNGSMEPNTDGAIFGNDNYNIDGYVDIYLSGTGGAKADATQNGKGAINVTAQNVVTIELKKPLNSSDTAGKDINWAQNETQKLTMIWDSNGRGSSGGSTNHYGSDATVDTANVRTLLINPNSLPQGGNPSPQDGNPILTNFDTTTAIIAVVIVIVAVLAIIFGVIWVRKRSAGKQSKAP